MTTEQDLTTIRSKHLCSGVYIQSDVGLPSALHSRCKSHPESQLRLGLMFTHVCLYRKLDEAHQTPSWPAIGQVARPMNLNIRSRASCRADGSRLRTSRLSCCLSTPVGGFWPTTHSQFNTKLITHFIINQHIEKLHHNSQLRTMRLNNYHAYFYSEIDSYLILDP
jgi:hypothetical protein